MSTAIAVSAINSPAANVSLKIVQGDDLTTVFPTWSIVGAPDITAATVSFVLTIDGTPGTTIYGMSIATSGGATQTVTLNSTFTSTVTFALPLTGVNYSIYAVLATGKTVTMVCNSPISVITSK